MILAEMIFFYANPRSEMRSRPRCWEHYLPSNSRPNLFSGD
jgi:hypothetical protein